MLILSTVHPPRWRARINSRTPGNKRNNRFHLLREDKDPGTSARLQHWANHFNPNTKTECARPQAGSLRPNIENIPDRR